MSFINGFIKFRSSLNFRLLQLDIRQNAVKTFIAMNISHKQYGELQKNNNYLNIRNLNVLSTDKILLNQRRFKSTKKKKPREEQDSDDEEEEDQEKMDDDDEYVKDFKEVTIHVTSTRVDAIVKAGFNMSRNKAEQAVYDYLIRLNGEKILKKGTKVNVGDEVDLIKGLNDKNENFLDVSRLIVKDIMIKSGLGKCLVNVQKYRTLTIENYEDKWKPPEV